MTGEMGRDPLFREQYAAGVKPDEEFEAALGGSSAPRVSMPAAPQPLGGVYWSNPMGVRLR